jgi:hypothetical protein
MKRCYFLLPAILLVFFTNFIAAAQQNIFYQLKINNTAIGIENSVFTDALGSDNKIQHSASFEIVLNNNDATNAIITAIQDAATPQPLLKSRETAASASLQLVFTKVDSRTGATEEKNYSGIMLDEIKLPNLNGADQSAARVTIRLRATTVTVTPAGGKATSTGSVRNINIPVSNFMITMGALPCSRVAKISDISIKPADNTLQNFTIEISGADAAAWNQWFTTGAGGTKKEQGKIDLLANDFKTAVMTIQLTNVEIVSYSISNAGNMARATVGLRGRAAVVKKATQL